jgi:hypothetical protein
MIFYSTHLSNLNGILFAGTYLSIVAQKMYKDFHSPLSASSPIAVNSKENANAKAQYLGIYSNEPYSP